MTELRRTIFQDDNIYFGERELTNLCWTLIRVYKFKNQSREPKAIIFPNIQEVGGVKIELGHSEAGDGNSGTASTEEGLPDLPEGV